MARLSPISSARPSELSHRSNPGRARLGFLASSSIQVCRFPQWIGLAAIHPAVSGIHDSCRIHHGTPLAVEQWQCVHSDVFPRCTEHDSGESNAPQLVGFRRSDRYTDLPQHSGGVRGDGLCNPSVVTNSVSTVKTRIIRVRYVVATQADPQRLKPTSDISFSERVLQSGRRLR